MFRLFLCGIAIMITCIVKVQSRKKMDALIFDISNQPILETNEATEGVSFAAEGKIVANKKLSSYFFKEPCVYYHYLLEKYIGGKHETWRTVEYKVDYIPFYLEDSRGRLLIDIRGLDIDNSTRPILLPKVKKSDTTIEVLIPKEKNKKQQQLMSEMDAKIVMHQQSFREKGTLYRRSEYVLEPNINVFVYGYVEKDEYGERALGEHKDHPLIISRKTAKEFKAVFEKGKNLIYVQHLLLSAGFVLSALSSYRFGIASLHTHIFIAIIGGISLLGLIVFTLYNHIILLHNRLRNTQSNIDTELKRRHDLIDQLITSVQAYNMHEKKVQHILSILRGSVSSVSPQELKNTLLAVEEAYPDLKASKVFQQLVIHLTDTEERIAYSRNFYNVTVRNFNTAIQQFPASILAKLFGFHTVEFIQIDAQEKDVSVTT